MWSLDELADALATSLEAKEAELAAEQTHSGLDALSEVELHDVLASGMQREGWGVVREAPFPSQVEPARSRRGETARQAALRRERERCDLVVLPEGAATLTDPRDQFSDDIERGATLFAALEAPKRLSPAQCAAEPQEAWWLEFKSAGQFRVIDGYAKADKSYSSFVSGVLRDARKLDADPMIERSACGLLLFTAEQAIAEHDLAMMVHKLLDRDAPIREHATRHVPIADRIGNGWCSLALLRVRNDAARAVLTP